MRYTAPKPLEARTEVIVDDYQLCARCGRVMTNGETAIVVQRSPSWLIYSHPEGPDCPAKAVKGWLAVRRAEGIRSSQNKETPRRAEPVKLNCLVRECVCILDSKHIRGELDLVDYAPREIPTRSTGIRYLLSNLQFRMEGGSRCAVAQLDPEEGESHRGWQPVVCNAVEDDIIAAIDAGNLSRTVETALEIITSRRRRSYGTVRIVPAVDLWPEAIVGHGEVSELKGKSCTTRRSRLPKAQPEVLTWDSEGRPGEYALHSRRRWIKLNGHSVTELQAWKPKPEPFPLRYKSRNNPSAYDFQLAPKRKPIRHWPRGESHAPYGPVAVLKLEAVENLRLRGETNSFVPKTNSEEALTPTKIDLEETKDHERCNRKTPPPCLSSSCANRNPISGTLSRKSKGSGLTRHIGVLTQLGTESSTPA
jgi:hypothetical protein